MPFAYRLEDWANSRCLPWLSRTCDRTQPERLLQSGCDALSPRQYIRAFSIYRVNICVILIFPHYAVDYPFEVDSWLRTTTCSTASLMLAVELFCTMSRAFRRTQKMLHHPARRTMASGRQHAITIMFRQEKPVPPQMVLTCPHLHR